MRVGTEHTSNVSRGLSPTVYRFLKENNLLTHIETRAEEKPFVASKPVRVQPQTLRVQPPTIRQGIEHAMTTRAVYRKPEPVYQPAAQPARSYTEPTRKTGWFERLYKTAAAAAATIVVATAGYVGSLLLDRPAAADPTETKPRAERPVVQPAQKRSIDEVIADASDERNSTEDAPLKAMHKWGTPGFEREVEEDEYQRLTDLTKRWDLQKKYGRPMDEQEMLAMKERESFAVSRGVAKPTEFFTDGGYWFIKPKAEPKSEPEAEPKGTDKPVAGSARFDYDAFEARRNATAYELKAKTPDTPLANKVPVPELKMTPIKDALDSEKKAVTEPAYQRNVPVPETAKASPLENAVKAGQNAKTNKPVTPSRNGNDAYQQKRAQVDAYSNSLRQRLVAELKSIEAPTSPIVKSFPNQEKVEQELASASYRAARRASTSSEMKDLCAAVELADKAYGSANSIYERRQSRDARVQRGLIDDALAASKTAGQALSTYDRLTRNGLDVKDPALDEKLTALQAVQQGMSAYAIERAKSMVRFHKEIATYDWRDNIDNIIHKKAWTDGQRAELITYEKSVQYGVRSGNIAGFITDFLAVGPHHPLTDGLLGSNELSEVRGGWRWFVAFAKMYATGHVINQATGGGLGGGNGSSSGSSPIGQSGGGAINGGNFGPGGGPQ